MSLALAVANALKVKRLQNRWRVIFDGAKGENIERMLLTHLRDRMELQAQIDELRKTSEILTEKSQVAKRYVGLVRYDAFEDVGGAQSFALAIYDEKGDGVVLTSVIGRADCRVYCKPLVRGRSERTLSQEEQRAIVDAVESGPRPILSP